MYLKDEKLRYLLCMSQLPAIKLNTSTCIYCCIYYDVNYLYLLVMICQNEIMLAAAVSGGLNKVKEAIKKNANINEQDPYVSYTLL